MAMMVMKKIKRLVIGSGSGAWAVAILLNAIMVIGLLSYGKDGVSWEYVPFLRKAFSGDKAASGDGEQMSSPTLSLPEVVVGLRGSDSDLLYVDAAFSLEVASERDREAVSKQIPRVRDTTIGFLSDVTPTELRGSGELARTKARLLERFRNVLPSQRLKAVYLTYLAVARL